MREPDPSFKRWKRHTLELIATDLQLETYRLRHQLFHLEDAHAELKRRYAASIKLHRMLFERYRDGTMASLLAGPEGRLLEELLEAAV